VEQIDVRLIDQLGVNDNLLFVLTDTVRLIEKLRSEGRTVLVHCVAAQSRTPTVAALYGARKRGISGHAALQEVTSVLQDAYPTAIFSKSSTSWHHDDGGILCAFSSGSESTVPGGC
jgi:hypothetical protein